MSDMLPGHETHGHSSNTEVDWGTGSNDDSTENFNRRLCIIFVKAGILLAITLVIIFWLLYKPVS